MANDIGSPVTLAVSYVIQTHIVSGKISQCEHELGLGMKYESEINLIFKWRLRWPGINKRRAAGPELQ